MAPFDFRGVDESNWLAVCACGHVDRYDERQVESRRCYLEEEAANGVRVVVAHLDGQPGGFVEVVPIERAARDVRGEGALLVHCVTVFRKGLGVGRALIDEASRLALTQSRDLVVDALAGVYGFMPVAFFSRLGFELVETRGTRRLMVKRLGRSTGEKPARPIAAYMHPT
ncbi:MAG: GNAT family N-acetyltransferase, partial [Bacillota bacterium]